MTKNQFFVIIYRRCKERYKMKTIRLDVEDNIFDKVMFFLNNLPKKDIKLNIEDNNVIKKSKKLNAISIKTKGFKFDREKVHER